jgi:hypothetical protein
MAAERELNELENKGCREVGLAKFPPFENPVSRKLEEDSTIQKS